MAVSIIDKMLTFRGIDPSRVVDYGTSASITPTKDGVWVVGGISSQGNPLPIIYAYCNGTVIETVVGSNNAGDNVVACIPVKSGVSYSVQAFRINVNTSKLYY